jgi:AraC-like DNA-binding protein/quercetin dioxygenase-like cupin family protein
MVTRPTRLDSFLGDRLPEVLSLGTMLFDPVWSQTKHRSAFSELLHVVSGRLTVVTSTGRAPAEAGETVWIPTEVSHRDEFDPEEGLEVFTVFFVWPGEAAAPGAKRRVRRLSFHPDTARLLADLRATPLEEGDEAPRSLRARLLTILLAMLEPQRAPGAAEVGVRRRELADRALRYVHEHYHEPISLGAMAEALHVSPYYLSHVFSESGQTTLFACLTQIRMDRARELLREGGHKVAEVADAVGYPDPHYFSRVFKRHVGCTPGAYARARG